MIARLFALLLGALLTTIPAMASADTIVGYWYGTGYQPSLGTDDEFIFFDRPDGTFTIHFRTYKGCAVTEDHTEAGTWARVDPTTVRVTTTQVEDAQAGPYTDDYKAVELTETDYRYIHVQTGVVYTARRVDANFDFPNCGLTS